jgi:hypothetical protein
VIGSKHALQSCVDQSSCSLTVQLRLFPKLEARIIPRHAPIGFISCLFICTVAMIELLIFTWRAWLMLFVLVGVTSLSTMAAVIIGIAIVAAAALHSRLSGRPF